MLNGEWGANSNKQPSSSSLAQKFRLFAQVAQGCNNQVGKLSPKKNRSSNGCGI
ncbi:hypothetical protein BDP55DRAFT_661308 [Colletotrichum godetiae]|uniref:Uncharacterized protein n=1 Tax=Colletotrichum godetiae TaxID=1209918 RepID=A0AAJ0EWL8_9PEZI|nr:uncharacterized protein BDP55DRAFT_661308 [Colletotrichum godetiae]KAK1676478.1 hypothetical protein BDP55DRAFT_661308 [Colletotrichum godetiae]